MLEEIEDGLGISSGLAGLVTTMPVLCFAAIGFAGPPLSARFRDSHVLAGALLAMAAGLVCAPSRRPFWLFLIGTVLAMVGGALGNVLLPSLVKRYFPDRTGLLVGAYSTALAAGGAVAAVSTAPIAAAVGRRRLAMGAGLWAVPALRRGAALAGRPARRARPGRRTSPSACGTWCTAAWPGAVGLLRPPGHAGLRHHRLVGAVPPRHGAVRGDRRAAARR